MVFTVVLIFLNRYLAAPWPNLGYYWGDSLTHPMLITAFYIFDPKVTGSFVTRFESLSSADGLVGGLNRQPSDSYYKVLTQSCLLLNGFIFPCCFHAFLKNFFVPLVDINREGGGGPNF